jgi:hypothetical protein
VKPSLTDRNPAFPALGDALTLPPTETRSNALTRLPTTGKETIASIKWLTSFENVTLKFTKPLTFHSCQ